MSSQTAPNVETHLPRRLNLGCGRDYRRSWHNVDVNPEVDTDQRIDLEDTPWGLPTGHFELVECRHVLEHLDTVPWDELTRVLQPSGTLRWTYPIGHTRFEDATHSQFWNIHTAEQVSGDREHGHETGYGLRLVDKNLKWWISQSEPLVELYTRYRLWRCGPGPWLEQIPGLYGEVTATYRLDDAGGGVA